MRGHWMPSDIKDKQKWQRRRNRIHVLEKEMTCMCHLSIFNDQFPCLVSNKKNLKRRQTDALDSDSRRTQKVVAVAYNKRKEFRNAKGTH